LLARRLIITHRAPVAAAIGALSYPKFSQSAAAVDLDPLAAAFSSECPTNESDPSAGYFVG